jgi:lipid-A-disaccharide synthase
MTSKRILIVAGEPSGDLHASNLVQDLKKINPDIEFFGLGGTKSKDAGVDVIFDIAHLAIVGLIDVIKNIFTIGKVYKEVLAKLDSRKTDLAILVDYPGFNLRLAKELKKRNIPVIYYISPQIWAWGRDRIKIIQKCVTKMVVFFKFEEELYKTYNVDAAFIGHPLIETVKPKHDKPYILKKLGLSTGKTTIAILPGSRKSEISHLLQTLVGASKLINEELGNVQFVLSKHPSLPLSLYEKTIEGSGLKIALAEGDTYDIVAASDFAIVASGTATLETSILGTPYVLVYRSDIVTYIAYKIVADIKNIGIANIIAGKQIVPELLQYDMTPEKVSAAVIDILTHEDKKSKMLSDLKDVRLSLGGPGASTRAAEAIAPYVN